MRFGFVVNDRREPSEEQTTTLLISAARRRGHEVLVCGVGDLSLNEDGTLLANACLVSESDPVAVAHQLSNDGASCEALDEQDLCVVRTNPARDDSHRTAHVAALRLLVGLEERGVRVINDPRGLTRALTKLSLLEIPAAFRPRTLVTRDAAAIERFLEQESARIVIKPLEGTRGRDVFMLEPSRSQSNTRQIIDVVLRQGYAMVQEFVPGAEHGDVRVVVVDGEILALGDREAAVARVPSTNDFRSNLHAGGVAEAAEVTALMRNAVAHIAPYLDREGLVHVGVDFVGGRILELNVFSPGGLRPSETLYGQDFSDAVIQAFERRV